MTGCVCDTRTTTWADAPVAPDVPDEVVRIGVSELTIRPIGVDDAPRLERMFGRLSRTSVYFRFFSPIPRLSSPVLRSLVDLDHCRRDALAAVVGDEIVAVARYDATATADDPEPAEAEIAVTVEDAWHHRGLGTFLVPRLAELAQARGFDAFVARILPDNRAALGLVRKLVPDARVRFAGGHCEVRVPLRAVSGPGPFATALRAG